LRFLLILLGFALVLPVRAQSPDVEIPCFWRETSLTKPWIGADVPCLEEVIWDRAAGELAFTGLAVSPDNTLFAARPTTGEVFAIVDTNDDLLPDTPRLVAEGLARPNSLAYHEGALYIGGEGHIYRLAGSEISVLVADLPAGTGFWTGGIAIAHDRLYVGIGAPCDRCVPEDPARGVILSYALDGTDRQIVARGLRHPAGLAFDGESLWTVDSAPDGSDAHADHDEVNRIVENAHFGWPYCIGVDNQPDLSNFACDEATAPLLTLPSGSRPLAIAAYTSQTLPALTGTLLVALSGSHNQLDLRGYQVIAVEPGSPPSYRSILPADPAGETGLSVAEINRRGVGLWPHRPLGLAINDWGWVYISLSGGRILAMRPQALNPY
jgi:glucose/arabinose dehydrogenase